MYINNEDLLKVTGDFRAFFIGHRGNIEAKYTTNLGVCLNTNKRQSRTKTSSQKVVNYNIITLTIYHSFNKQVKCGLDPRVWTQTQKNPQRLTIKKRL